MKTYLFLTLLLISNFHKNSASNSKKSHTEVQEIYSYHDRKIEERESADFEEILEAPIGSTIPVRPIPVAAVVSERIEDYFDLAISDGESLHWTQLPRSEMPKSESLDVVGQFTTVNVPLFYGNDAEKLGIPESEWRGSFFAIYLRKYYWKTLDTSRPVNHVILVAGGPGESGKSWIDSLHKLSRQYGRKSTIFYVADHRGVYQSRDVVQLITKETDKGHVRTSWRRKRRSESENEADWIKRVDEFEEAVGFPLVSMTCSNAARDLALISTIIKRHFMKSNARIYLHAQSYGTQVSTRALNLLPNFYDGVLLEGLATMELVKESAKADFGILSSCAEDRKCSQMFSFERPEKDLLPLTGPFDLKHLLEGMAKRPHNRACRDIFLNAMRSSVYSDNVSFWDAIHLSFYEMLADDFTNPYTGDKGNFYPGILVPFLIRDMYYCSDSDRFSRQMTKFVEILAISVRGLETPYVKRPQKTGKSKDQTPAKSKPSDSKQISSYFVLSYINMHEAFDMKRMSTASERRYCDIPNQPDLVNQCPIWRAQVRKLEMLASIRGAKTTPSATKKPSRRSKLDKFEGKDKSSSSEEAGSSSDSDDYAESSNGSDSETAEANGLHKTIELFKFSNDHRHKQHRKKHRGGTYKKNRDFFEGIKWLRSQKSEKNENDIITTKSPKTKKGKDKTDSDRVKGKRGEAGVHYLKRYYYDLDELAYQIPSTEKTRIFVTVGSLDVKTPILEARRMLTQIRAPLKMLFELKNVAHATEPCRTEIIRAMIAADGTEREFAIGAADECVRELGSARKLDWELKDVKGIDRNDWIV